MKKDHYTTLEVPRTASEAQIRAAYRKLASRLHPDRAPDPESQRAFLEITRAFEVLSDERSRRLYDLDLLAESRKAAEAKMRDQRAGTAERIRRDAAATHVVVDVHRVSVLFAQGRHGEAESLARQILAQDPAQPIPYAVLGDVARMKGRRAEAQRMYAYAVQFDPGNALFQRRYEELLSTLPKDSNGPRTPGDAASGIGLAVGAVAVTGAAIFVIASSGDGPAFPQFRLASTWTWSLIAMLFASGLAVGACLSLGGLVDRFRSSAVGGPSPTVAFGLLALGSFWGAIALYGIAGTVWKSFHESLNRLIGAVALATIALTLAAAFTSISPGQVLLWGGNVSTLGAILGWMAADAFRS